MRARRSVLPVAMLALGLASGLALGILAVRPAATAATAPAVTAVTDDATPDLPRLPGGGTRAEDAAARRAAIRASVTAALAEQRRGHDLDVFLDELEATARRQGQVTAVETLTGLAAIDAANPDDPARAPAFTHRMERLQRELGQVPAEPDAPSARISALTVVDQVRATPAGPARDALTRRALDAINRLPQGEQDEARDGLDRATAAGLPPAPPPPVEAVD